MELNMKEISSVNNEYIKSLHKLKEKKNRIQEKKFLIEGFHLVEEAYKANKLIQILTTQYVSKFESIEQIIVSEPIIEKLSFTKNPQGIIGVCKMSSNNEIKGSKILLLDNVNDPGNLGTLIRSSLGFYIDTIVLSEDCVDLYNDKTIRATQGAMFNINIIVADLKNVIDVLQKQNIKVIGTSLQSSKNLKEIEKIDKYAILLGNEANGVKAELLEKTNFNVRIEMNNKLESLNVSVAGSIIMYYLNN
jgi:TrmH family RNA methyltransferase